MAVICATLLCMHVTANAGTHINHLVTRQFEMNILQAKGYESRANATEDGGAVAHTMLMVMTSPGESMSPKIGNAYATYGGRKEENMQPYRQAKQRAKTEGWALKQQTKPCTTVEGLRTKHTNARTTGVPTGNQLDAITSSGASYMPAVHAQHCKQCTENNTKSAQPKLQTVYRQHGKQYNMGTTHKVQLAYQTVHRQHRIQCTVNTSNSVQYIHHTVHSIYREQSTADTSNSEQTHLHTTPHQHYTQCTVKQTLRKKGIEVSLLEAQVITLPSASPSTEVSSRQAPCEECDTALDRKQKMHGQDPRDAARAAVAYTGGRLPRRASKTAHTGGSMSPKITTIMSPKALCMHGSQMRLLRSQARC